MLGKTKFDFDFFFTYTEIQEKYKLNIFNMKMWEKKYSKIRLFLLFTMLDKYQVIFSVINI